MQCSRCNSDVTPGLELRLVPDAARAAHCPYCLTDLPHRQPGTACGSALGRHGREATLRATRRRELRDRFVARLHNISCSTGVRCPICNQGLNDNDEALLRERDHFRCHRCGHDLAYLAYRQHAYDEENWQPLLSALADQQAEPRCRDCRYLGAIAKAAEAALAGGVHTTLNRHHLLASVLGRFDWEQPECSWEKDCELVELYRSTAGEALRLL